jgi:hypothetical protein
MVYKNTCDLYWFGPRSALHPVGEVSSILSCTKVLVVGVTSGCERGRISQVSWCEWKVWACATLLVPLQGPGELLVCDWLGVVVVVVLFSPSGSPLGFFGPLGTIPTCSFYSLKEVQGYKMWACGVAFAGGA